MSRRFALALLAMAAFAQWEVSLPRAGCQVDQEGRLRTVWGVAGSFVAGQVQLQGVISYAASHAWTVAKLKHVLVLMDASGEERARLDAPAGHALFAFDDAGVPALAYFPAEHMLYRIRAGDLEPVRTLEEEVAAIARLDERRLLALVRRNGRLEMVEFAGSPGSPGALVERLPWDGPALILGRAAILVAQGALVHMRSSEGELESFALPAPVTALNLMGAGWVEIVTRDAGRFALRVAPGEARLDALPEAAP